MDTGSLPPLRPQTLEKVKMNKIPEAPPVAVQAAEPEGMTNKVISILQQFTDRDFVRICALPIMDLGISNPADMWADDFDDLCKRCRNEVLDEENNVRNYWIQVSNYLQQSSKIPTADMIAVSVCKIAGWKCFLRDVDGIEVD